MLFPLLVVSASVFIAGSLHGAAAQEIPQPPRNGFLRLLSQEEMECHAIFGSQPRELVVVNGVVKDGDYCASICRPGVFSYFMPNQDNLDESAYAYYDCGTGKCRDWPDQPGRVQCFW